MSTKKVGNASVNVVATRASRRERKRREYRKVSTGTIAKTSCSRTLKTTSPESPVVWASTVGRMFTLRQAL